MSIDDRLHYFAALLLEHGGGTMQLTNLNKALFYLDLLWLREHGETLTGETYVALEKGPTVEHYPSRLVAEMVRAGFISEDEDELPFGIVAKPVTLSVEVVEPEDAAITDAIQTIAAFASGRNAGELSDFSHRNRGWAAAWEKGTGTPINMVQALGQIVDPDPWIDEGLSDEERDLIESRSAGEFIPFSSVG